jgi:hypothetical protein
MRSLEVKIMQEQNEIKARYEERIRGLEKKLKKFETPEPD